MERGHSIKNLVIILVVVLIAAGAFFALKGPDLTPKESEYLEFKLGAKASPEMKATEETQLFKVKGEIYYSVFSTKPFENAATVEVVIKNTADLSKPTFTEALGTTPEKKIMRPINPVNAESTGDGHGWTNAASAMEGTGERPSSSSSS